MDREPPILQPPVASVAQPRKGWWKFLPILALTAFVSAVVFVARYEPVANKQYYPSAVLKKPPALIAQVAAACVPLMRLPAAEYSKLLGSVPA